MGPGQIPKQASLTQTFLFAVAASSLRFTSIHLEGSDEVDLPMASKINLCKSNFISQARKVTMPVP